MHVAIIEVRRKSIRPELIAVDTEEELIKRIEKLQLADNVVSLHIYRCTTNLTREVIFVES